ncbi:arginine decarboxylase [Ferrimonas gelatinilytica]|uniref:Arginine decarboxylase n=1 Tax=Ferrimonas gelatinilytica TaxID=1255257 RepID=A0ABP9S118_9GAMM
MIKTGYQPIKSKVLVIDEGLAKLDSTFGRNTQALVEELSARDVVVVTAQSFDDGMAVIVSDASIHGVLLSWELKSGEAEGLRPAERLLNELNQRHRNIPVFLMATNSEQARHITEEVMSKVEEFVWMLEDTADFIAGRLLAAVARYRAQLLPPFSAALAKYSMLKEQSWSAPGHQGGIAFTKLPVGRAFFDFYGENLFRTDMGIERGQLGSLLDHTGPVAESEAYAARVFGAHQSYNVVGGTSESNRTIMQACMIDGEVAICDRNCHKSIEQGLMLTGALPVYMVPTRNRYGIIGPVPASDMSPESIKKKIASSPLTKNVKNADPVYAVLTSCTYDGLCYNAVMAESLLGQSSPRVHLDEAWYGYARFNPVYADHFAMRGDPAEHDPKGPTVFATHSTHKLLTALSQASYIHIRHGRDAIPHDQFNQSYMMHATTSPLYAIVASNDIASAMMDGDGGTMLTTDSIKEAVSFRQAVAKIYKRHQSAGDWFFKPWNAEKVKDPRSGQVYDFQDAPTDLLVSEQDCWRLHPEDTWHGFDDLETNWVMLDPIKVSLLTPGMGDDGTLEENGVPAELFTAYAGRFGIVPTRTTDFQVMFLFSMGTTKGKWATLINVLLSFKRFYDSNAPLSQVLPELVQSNPERYGHLGLKDLGDEMFAFLKKHDPGAALNAAYSTIPEPTMTPRAAFQQLAKGRVELVPAPKLYGRIAANAVMPYPPGIPMMISGEKFAKSDSPQIDYLIKLSLWDEQFPGFEHEVEGAEIEDGVYSVLCLKA